MTEAAQHKSTDGSRKAEKPNNEGILCSPLSFSFSLRWVPTEDRGITVLPFFFWFLSLTHTHVFLCYKIE